ncbi:immunoglobulin kappa light chain-like [Misgurnus anguillicaudatus]|uniref:immunoglobulin kappa light chain-like n=1 Tax=Misgurnus anguillicaudatus TaxID=75329 RepID=UPI003CCFC8A8
MTTNSAVTTMIFIIVWTLCSIQGLMCQVVVTQSGDQTVEPGQTVTIECKHTPSINIWKAEEKKDSMFWYHQIPGEVPKLLIYYTSNRASGVSERFSGSGNTNSIDFTLTISKVQPEDSGVYYCMAYGRLNGFVSLWYTFGGGTRLSVGSNRPPTLTVLPPSRDELKQGKATVMCVGSKGYPSDWKLNWKVDCSSRSSGVNLNPSVLLKDGLYSWSSSLSLTASEWRSAYTISCEATKSSQNPVTKTINIQQCDIE